MLRTARQPRWLALLVVAVLVLLGAIQLGRWQWQVAHDVARAETVREIQERPVRPLGEVIAPHQPFPDDGSGQQVATRGRYEGGEQLLVADRLLDGRHGQWVLDRFVVADGGGNLPVVRGWIPDGASPPSPPSGTVELVGSLAPGEAPDTGEAPAGQVATIDLAQLVNEWPGELYTAFAFVVTEDGAAPTQGLTVVPPPLPDTSFNIRNASYAFQWWAFGGFAIWMWVTMVRHAHRREQAEHAPGAPDAPDTPDAPDAPSDSQELQPS